MKKTRFNETRRIGSKTRTQLLNQHTNHRGEISPGLESAIKIAGPCLSVNPQSALACDFEAGALLLEGKNHRVLWAPAVRLEQIKSLAEEHQADWIANWDGFAETKNVQAPSDSMHQIQTLSSMGQTPIIRDL